MDSAATIGFYGRVLGMTLIGAAAWIHEREFTPSN